MTLLDVALVYSNTQSVTLLISSHAIPKPSAIFIFTSAIYTNTCARIPTIVFFVPMILFPLTLRFIIFQLLI